MKEIYKEYASAIYSLAAENRKEAEYLYGMRLINNELNRNPDYAMILNAPSISKSDRLSLIEKAFSGKVTEHVLSLLMLMCERGCTDHFSEVYEVFAQMYLNFASAAKADVTSAVPLDSSEKAVLRKKLEKMSGRAVSINYIVDPSIIGGMIVELEGRVIDGSLKNRLKEIKEVIKQ
ncbi:MAG: ATP synthase F1 subunit delta [Ruminococcus sp.]|nr:ATP synthase F1 subunit delta [Ruminococcus sp.]